MWLTYAGSRHYLKLHKLPVDVFYMAYYLNETLMLHMSGPQNFDYPYMVSLKNRKEFLRKMQETEIHFFGATRQQAKDVSRSIDFSRRTPIESRRFTPGTD